MAEVRVSLEGGGSKVAGNMAAGMGSISSITAIASGVNKIFGFITDAIKDVPIIASVMKLLKLIIGILFIPLIPILKPVLTGLATFIKQVVPILIKAGATLEKMMGAGIFKVVGGIAEFLAELLGGTIKIVIFVLGLFVLGLQTIWEMIKLSWDAIIFGLVNVWDMLKTAWEGLVSLGTYIYAAIQAAWHGLIFVGQWIWDKVLKPAFEFLKDVGSWIWDIIKAPFVWLKDAISSVVDWIASHLPFNVGGRSRAIGGPISEEGVYYLHRGERVMSATEGRRGGSPNLSISINNPNIRNDMDIKKLIKELQRQMQIDMRRYVSY